MLSCQEFRVAMKLTCASCENFFDNSEGDICPICGARYRKLVREPRRNAPVGELAPLPALLVPIDFLLRAFFFTNLRGMALLVLSFSIAAFATAAFEFSEQVALIVTGFCVMGCDLIYRRVHSLSIWRGVPSPSVFFAPLWVLGALFVLVGIGAQGE